MSAAEQLAGTVELLEMVLLALPLRDLLLARRVSRTCRSIVDSSAALNEARAHPFVSADLHLPARCSLSSTERARLEVDLTLHWDQPVTVQHMPSPLQRLSCLVYRSDQETTTRMRSPYTHSKTVFQLSRKSEWRYFELLPGTPLQLVFDFGAFAGRPGFEHLDDVDAGLKSVEARKTYVLAVREGLMLPSYVGRMHSLLEQVDAGISIEGLRFHRREHGAKRDIRNMLRIVSTGSVTFEVTAWPLDLSRLTLHEGQENRIRRRGEK